MKRLNEKAPGIFGVLLIGGLTLAVLPDTQAVTIDNPNQFLLNVFQQEEPTWIEHYPLRNGVSWELFVRNGICSGGTCRGGTNGAACTVDTDCGGSALTFSGGKARFYDQDGSLLIEENFSPTRFRNTVNVISGPAITIANGNAIVGANSNIGVLFPAEFLGLNVVPATAEMELCFDELEAAPGGCANPLRARDVQLIEYLQPPGQTYIYPLGNPAQAKNAGGMIFTGDQRAHEIGTAHRLARNQRYAWDVGVLVGGNARQNNDDSLDDSYIYGEPVFAPADGVITVVEKGHPENPRGAMLPGVGACLATTCGEPQNCDTAAGEIPGGGNMVVIDHGTGEFSFMAHMIPGSNSTLNCGDTVSQGDQIGMVGNSGSSGGPHIHLSTVNGPNADPLNSVQNFPMYFNNVEFASTAAATARRQLDVNIPSGTEWTILAPPGASPANPLIPGTLEVEPNDTPGQHNTLGIPGSVSGVAENVPDTLDVPADVAIRGDGIEDIFRVDVPGADELRFSLASNSSENLDLYILTEDFRVENASREGTRLNDPNEQFCVNVDQGTHYLMVTNNDRTKSADAAYDLRVEPDPQRIDLVIDNPSDPIEVDDSCDATIHFTATIEDGCCLDPESLDLNVVASNPTNNASLGPVRLDPVTVVSPTRITVAGSVQVRDLTSCPAEIVLSATARDCHGNEISSADNEGDASTTVVDNIPPVLTASLETDLLWPPDATLAPLGFVSEAFDNCNGGEVAPPMTSVWSDETETGVFSPDARETDADFLVRRERLGSADGRVYLLTTATTDSCGNTSFVCTATGVPHDLSVQQSVESLGTQIEDAIDFCEANGTAPPEYTEQGSAAAVGPKQ
ncbi:MAG: M23 family metallopeptidase [Gammaproteobacteria bacterium]